MRRICADLGGGGDIGNRILNPCLAFLWCSMFLLWLFCVINSGCINPEAPRNVYQYTDSVSDSLETFKPEMFLVRLKHIQNQTEGYLFSRPEQFSK